MVISALRRKSKFEFRTFLEKIQILGFPWCSTREGLSIDISITNVGLILTKLWWFQLFVKSQNSNFELFWKKIQILRFPWCSTREDLSIDVSITNVGLILTKYKSNSISNFFEKKKSKGHTLQLFVESQNSNFDFFFFNSNFGVSMV